MNTILPAMGYITGERTTVADCLVMAALSISVPQVKVGKQHKKFKDYYSAFQVAHSLDVAPLVEPV
jgi:glutathione S-transferase